MLEPRALLAMTIGEISGVNPPDNLIANGSFETPVLQDNKKWDTFVGKQIEEWTVVSTGEIMAEIQRVGLSTWDGSEGDQWIELDGDENGPGKKWDATAKGRKEQGLYAIQQAVSGLTPGQAYALSFDFAARPGTSLGENRLRAEVIGDGGTVLQGVGGELTVSSGQGGKASRRIVIRGRCMLERKEVLVLSAKLAYGFATDEIDDVDERASVVGAH